MSKKLKGAKNTSPEALLEGLKEEFVLHESAICTDIISNIKLTYAYLEDFIYFAKKKDTNICLTAIPKTGHLGFSTQDINQCLRRYEANTSHDIYYVDYKFAEDYECPHGSEYKNIWIMFIAKDEHTIADLLSRFQKLKAFL